MLHIALNDKKYHTKNYDPGQAFYSIKFRKVLTADSYRNILYSTVFLLRYQVLFPLDHILITISLLSSFHVRFNSPILSLSVSLNFQAVFLLLTRKYSVFISLAQSVLPYKPHGNSSTHAIPYLNNKPCLTSII